MSTHPFEGEGFDHRRSIRFWDDIANDYEGGIMQGDIPERIISSLFDRGILTSDSEVLELGCGPGTYSAPLSERVRALTCGDTSERMLSILSKRCLNGNIRTILGDFMTADYGGRYDAVMMTLCPGTGSPDGIRRVESLSKGWCIHIMWVDNTWDDIHAEVWKKLGKDYSFDGRKVRIMEMNLESLGRDYDVSEFTADIHWELPADELIEREKRTFSVYGPYDAESAIREVLSDHIDGDVFSFDCRNVMKMITWRSPSC